MRKVILISPFTRYFGHHVSLTHSLAFNLARNNINVQIICTSDIGQFKDLDSYVKITKVDYGISLIHKLFSIKLNIQRNNFIFKFTQNLETLLCGIVAWYYSKGESIFWMDGRHNLLLLFVLLIKKSKHGHLVLGTIPYKNNKCFGYLKKLYDRAFSTGRLTFVTETDAITNNWKTLAYKHVVTIPYALNEVKKSRQVFSRKDLDIKPDTFVCLLFGTHREGKDYKTVIQAAIKSKSKPLLLFAGPLISSNDPRILLKKLNYPHSISLIKFLSEEEMKSLFFLSDCAILPYSKNYEKGSAILLQASQYNIPVIASRSGHLQRFIDENKTGMYYESGHADDLASKIDEMRNLKLESLHFWDVALQAVRSKYSWDTIIQEYIKILF